MNDQPSSHPRTAIVTGGSRGIGRAIAVALGSAGFNVAINYNRNAQAADEAAELVKHASDGRAWALTVQADISQGEDRARLVERTVEQFGGIDLLVNNAGVGPRVRADILEADEEEFDYVLNTNLKGPYFLTQLVAKRMMVQSAKPQAAKTEPQAAKTGPQAAGTIINIGSMSAYTASINRGEYCVAKAGMAMMTKLFAVRLAAHGINVYEIRPGIIQTDMTSAGPVKAKYDKLILEDGLTPIRRWGQPEDVAQAVLAVAQGRLPFSTGEVINVDGGFHLHTL